MNEHLDAPLVNAVRQARQRMSGSMQIPGHKGQYVRPSNALGWQVLHDIIRDDVALQGWADDNHFTNQWLATAEQKYAHAIGADHTRFIVGGSSQGNIAAFLAVAQPERPICVDRTSHRSALAGLVLSGATPLWLFPDIHPDFGIPLGVNPRTLTKASAVFVTSPAYVGTLSDVTALADAAHALGMPLVVDQAWGAHLDWIESSGALAQGADLVVTSIHKALLGYSQSATVSCHSKRIDIARLDRSVDITATTSPSATLLASIDATRYVLEQDRGITIERVTEVTARARRLLAQVPGLVVLDDHHGIHIDPWKIALFMPGTGTTGTELAKFLWNDFVGVESADTDTLIATVSLVDTDESVDAFIHRVVKFIDAHRGPARPSLPSATWQVRPDVVMSPREAMFAPRKRVALTDAVGHISAEQFCPYPPGVPLIAPGERVTSELVEAISLAGRNGRVAYNSDPTLATIEVIDQ